jgi:hypothetical protein
MPPPALPVLLENGRGESLVHPGRLGPAGTLKVLLPAPGLGSTSGRIRVGWASREKPVVGGGRGRGRRITRRYKDGNFWGIESSFL